MWIDFQKFFHQRIRKKIRYVHITKISTSPAICCYTTFEVENPTIFVMYTEVCYESAGERILKICPYLPKLLSNIKQLTFLEHGVERRH